MLDKFTAFFVFCPLCQTHFYPRVEIDRLRAKRALHFVQVGKHHPFAFGVDAFTGHVVQTQHNVLRRHDNRVTVCRRQHVIGGHHQRARFKLSFQGQRHVYRHLVAVKVRVVSRTDKRVQLNRLAFNKHRLKGLDAETVKGRRAVKHHRMLANNIGQDVPHFRHFALNHLLSGFNRRRLTRSLQLGVDKRLKQLKRHFLRQTALVQTQRRADGDHRAARVVNAFAEKVLTETPLLAFNHIGKRLKRAFVRARDSAAAAPVIKQRIDRFLQHALFVAHDDVRRIEIKEPLQAIVAIDNAAIQIVQIRRRETAAVKRHQRTQIWRQHRQHLHHHPRRAIAGLVKRFQKLQALGQLFNLGVGRGLRNFFAQPLYLFT